MVNKNFIIVFILTSITISVLFSLKKRSSPDPAPNTKPKIDCAGEWGTCQKDCTQSYVVHVPPKNGGKECPQTQTRSCKPGEGACPNVPVNCVGHWGPCQTDCQQPYIADTPAQYGGKPCPGPRSCNPGQGSCPKAPVDCVGKWTSCAKDCKKQFNTITAAQNGGTPCFPSHGEYEDCTDGDCALDCQFTWSPCNKDCMTYRTIVKKPVGKGKACPDIQFSPPLKTCYGGGCECKDNKAITPDFPTMEKIAQACYCKQGIPDMQPLPAKPWHATDGFNQLIHWTTGAMHPLFCQHGNSVDNLVKYCNTLKIDDPKNKVNNKGAYKNCIS